MKKILFLSQLFLILFSCSTFGMKKELAPRPEVPAELSREIIQFIMNQANLEDAIDAIKKYAIIDPKIEKSPRITKFLLDLLAKEYLHNDIIEAALRLQTLGSEQWLSSEDAKKWVAENSLFAERKLTEATNINKIKTLLNLGVNPNTPQVLDNATPLNSAVATLNIPEVELLLHAGADPNFSGPRYFPPLFTALQFGRIDVNHADQLKIIQLLLDAGADPNLPMGAEETILSLARIYNESARSLESAQVISFLENYKPQKTQKIRK